MIICIDATGIVDWLNSFIEHAEDNVHDHSSQVDPEKIFECLSCAEVQKGVLFFPNIQESGVLGLNLVELDVVVVVSILVMVQLKLGVKFFCDSHWVGSMIS